MGFLLAEDGGHLLDEAGNPLLDEAGLTPVSGGFLYLGPGTYVYPQYLNKISLKTLVAVSGQTYLILGVGGNPGLSIPPNDDSSWVSS